MVTSWSLHNSLNAIHEQAAKLTNHDQTLSFDNILKMQGNFQKLVLSFDKGIFKCGHSFFLSVKEYFKYKTKRLHHYIIGNFKYLHFNKEDEKRRRVRFSDFIWLMITKTLTWQAPLCKYIFLCTTFLQRHLCKEKLSKRWILLKKSLLRMHFLLCSWQQAFP